MFANALQDMKMFEAVSYLKDMVDKFLEQELDELTNLFSKNSPYCNKVRDHLQNSLTRASNYRLGSQGWWIQQMQTDSFVASEVKKDESVVEHTVVFEPADGVPVSCSCRFFQSIEIPCCGIVALLKQREDDPFDPKWLGSQWLISDHPLAKTALRRLGVNIVEELGNAISDNSISDNLFDANNSQQQTYAQLQARVDKVSAIPHPDSDKVRFATMTSAFNSLKGRVPSLQQCIAVQGSHGSYL